MVLGLSLRHPSRCSWNFFILQAWLPTLLASLGLSDLPTIGLLSSLPWLVRHRPAQLRLQLLPLRVCVALASQRLCAGRDPSA